MFDLPVFVLPLAIVFLTYWVAFSWSRSSRKLPPGPPGRDHVRLLGVAPWKTFKAWNDKYGPVITCFIGSQRNIVLGTMETAVDLLEKSGDVFSSRPQFPMSKLLFSELRGFSMPYGPKWRNWRTLQGSTFAAPVAPKIKPMQENESAILIHDCLLNKDLSKQHKILQRYTASLMFYVAYGRRITAHDDALCLEHEKIEKYIASTKVPGRYLIDSWPILLWLPRPLQWFRKEPEQRRAISTKLYMGTMNEVKRKIEDGSAVPCLATTGLRRQTELAMDDMEMAYALSAPWAAGIGTTTAALEIAILAMLHNPDCVRKVQVEIDNQVGADRMPTFEDQAALPYLDAFIKETMRWRAVTPTGIAHSSTKEHTYRDMTIPKESTVYANTAAILKDPQVFSDCELFIPERFLETSDPRLINYRFGCFGFGRRICPGMFVAVQSLYIAISRILWAYDVRPIEIDGKSYLPDAQSFTPGLVSFPADLKYQFVVRSEKHRAIIVSEASRAQDAMAGLDGSETSKV